MKRKDIIYNFSLLIMLSIIVGILIIKYNSENINDKLIISQEQVTDECIDEADALKAKENYTEIATSSAELTISPNAEFIIQKHYNKCGHTVKEYAEILPEMVNRNQQEIENMYTDFTVEAFESNMLIVAKNEEGFCGEHYILKEADGNIIVNTINENNKESLYEVTSISTEYLTQTDKINLKNGIKIYGKENLNSFLEDFE